ncbi:MAG: type II toxin-antitoxin system RelE/ParE family toxin [Eggerthella lenta]
MYGLSRVPERAELGYRCAPVKNYLVLYKVADGQIVVCRIIHRSRDYTRLL